MKINLMLPIDFTSCGLVSLFFLRELLKRGNEPSLFPTYKRSNPDDRFKEAIKVSLNNSDNFDSNGVGLRFSAPWDMAMSVGKTRMGYTFMETDILREDGIHHLSTLDKIIVPTQWQKNAIQNYVKKETCVVPLAIDHESFKPVKVNRRDTFTFLMVAEWGIKKNQDQVVEAFGKAFNARDDVELRIVSSKINSFATPIQERMMNDSIKKCHISYKIKIYHSNFMNVRDLNLLYNASDCFILVSKGEGWCMPLMEAMACGCHCITSNITGQTEFVNDKNCLLINPCGKEEAFDGIAYFGEEEWYKFKTNDIVEKMKYAFEHFKNKRNNEGIVTASRYTWSKAAEALEHELTI